MSKRKYKSGKPIQSVSDFENSTSRFFIVRFGPNKPKTLHRGFLTAWQYQTLSKFVKNGWVFEAEPIGETEA